jgi:WD40 repeat protein
MAEATVMKSKAPEPKPTEPRWNLPASGTLYALAVDGATGCAYVGGSAGTIYACDLNAATPALRPRMHDDAYVAALEVLRDGPQSGRLVAARYDGSLVWYDLHDGKRLRITTAHDGWIRDLCVVGDGRRLATVGHDMRVKVWEAADGKLVRSFVGHALETPQGYVSAIYAVAGSPDGRYVASADRVGEVRVWDITSGKEAARFRAAEFYTFDGEKRDRSIGGIRRIRFSPDGKRLALAGIGQITNVDGFVGPSRLEVWDWQTGKRAASLQDSHQAVLNDVLWSSDGRKLTAAGGGDGGGVLMVWDAAGKQPEQKLKFKGHAQRLARLDGGSLLLAAGFEGVQAWDERAWSTSASANATKMAS